MDPVAIDLSPLLQVAMGFVSVLATVALGFLSRYISQKTGVELDLKHNAMINEAIDKGIAFAQSRIAGRVTFETQNSLVALASSYVISGVPAALTHFNITPERVGEMIEARLAPPAPVEG